LDEDKLNFLLIQIEKQIGTVTLADLNNLPLQSNLNQIFVNYKKNFENLKSQIQTLIDDSNKCLSLHEQRESLLKSQLIESRLKCELLEQSLRVLAQENHDMESNKLHQDNVKLTTQLAKASTEEEEEEDEEDIPNEEDTVNQSAQSSDESEEFFDIDPISDGDEEADKSSVQTEELDASNIRSCYGSIQDVSLAKEDTNPTEAKSVVPIKNQLVVVDEKQKQMKIVERDFNGWRIKLPASMIDRSQISIWSILKQSIGKELSKIALPAAWCEPLTFLQRITENVYYSELLNKANSAVNPCKRMEYVAAFAVTCISSNIDRLSKPFNPLLGETYELVREDLGFKILCEQVSHHPPVTAFHADSTDSSSGWKYYGTVNPKTKFWGKSIEVYPKGTLTLELNKFNEVYTWQTVTCCVHNIIVGKLWFEYYGTMEIVCHQTGYKAVINFKPYSWSNKELNKLDGYIYDNKKNKLKALYGYWTHCLYSCDVSAYENYLKTGKPLPTVQLDEWFNEINNSNSMHKIHSDVDLANINKKERPTFNLNSDDDNIEKGGDNQHEPLDAHKKSNDLKNVPQASTASLPASSSNKLAGLTELWRAVPRPSYTADYYMFNYFTMTLNELKDEFAKVIAPTDSRFRTDVRQLELGNLEGATSEKIRLEEKQRETRKNPKFDYKGKWFKFTKHPYCNEEVWIFNNKYWQRNYADCMQLF